MKIMIMNKGQEEERSSKNETDILRMPMMAEDTNRNRRLRESRILAKEVERLLSEGLEGLAEGLFHGEGNLLICVYSYS